MQMFLKKLSGLKSRMRKHEEQNLQNNGSRSIKTANRLIQSAIDVTGLYLPPEPRALQVLVYA